MERTKVELTFSFESTPKDLFLALTKPAYLQNWIAEVVEYEPKSGVFTFHWGSTSESARIVEKDENRFLKWNWVEAEDRGEEDYVSFRIETYPDDDLLDLFVVDFCDADEEEAIRQGWEQQIVRLMEVIR